MNSKKKFNLVIPVVFGILVLALACWFLTPFLNSAKSVLYSPQEKMKVRHAGDWNRAAEYYQSIRANVNTGKVEISDVLMASEEVKKHSLKKSGSLNLQWAERGPDNVGGRTRAILVDKNNSSHVFAGSVSGGLFVSNNSGSSWHPVNDQFENLIVSSLAQAPDGSIWMGTGSDFDETANEAGVLFPGRGLFKSTNGGQSFTKVKGPVAPYVTFGIGGGGSGASATVTIAGDSVSSIDVVTGGSNYTIAPVVTINNGGGGGANAQAVATISGGTVTGVTVTKGGSGYTNTVNNESDDWITVNKIAFKPGNSNQIYVAIHNGLRVSNDGGQTWINPLFSNTTTCTGQLNGQRGEDLDVTSDGRLFFSYAGTIYYSDDPMDCGSYVKVVGVANTTGGRTDVAVAPSNPNVVYALVCDNIGYFVGVWKSTDKGVNWTKMLFPIANYFEPMSNSGLGYGQGVYDLAFAVAPDNADKIFIGGVQLWKYDGNLTRIAEEFSNFPPYYVHADKHVFSFDPNNPNIMYIGCDGGIFKSFDQGVNFFSANKGYNVTQFYAMAFNNPPAGMPTAMLGGAQDNGTQLMEGIGTEPLSGKEGSGGDGFDCDISSITGAMFGTIYSDQLLRSSPTGGSPSAICGAFCGEPTIFHTVVRLWESNEDYTSHDSILFTVDTTKQGIGTGNGSKKVFSGTLTPLQSSASLKIGSLRIQVGTAGVSINDFSNSSNTSSTFGTGGNSCSVNYSNGSFTLTLVNAPSVNTPVWAYFTTNYSSGSKLSLLSNTENIPVSYSLTQDMGYGDTVKVQDPIQSIIALGVAASKGGVAITRYGLRFNATVDSTWIKLNTTGTPSCIEFSKDGNHMFIGIDQIGVFRVSGLNNVYKQADVSGTPSKITKTKIFAPPASYAITGIAVDNDNPENVVVTLGNYGHTGYVYASTKAVTTTLSNTFLNVSGDLPPMPVYDAEFINHTVKVLIGTEFGIYSTQDIFAGNVQWADESSNFPHMPVFEVRQQKFYPSNNYEMLFIGTHGRGMWQSGSLVTGIKELPGSESKSKFISNMSVFPNPMKEDGYTIFNLPSPGKGSLKILDLNGRIVKEFQNKLFSPGANKIKLEAAGIPAGVYFVKVEAGNESAISKFVVVK